MDRPGHASIGLQDLSLISYYDETNGDLKVAYCSTACAAATTVTFNGPGDVDCATSMTIGSDGFGLISYYDQANFPNTSLEVAHCSNTLCQPNVRRR